MLHSAIRRHLLNGCGVYDPIPNRADVLARNWDFDFERLLLRVGTPGIERFVTLMKNRLHMGAIRYDQMGDSRPTLSDAYRRTGALMRRGDHAAERLVDCANYTWLMYRHDTQYNVLAHTICAMYSAFSSLTEYWMPADDH